MEVYINTKNRKNNERNTFEAFTITDDVYSV